VYPVIPSNLLPLRGGDWCGHFVGTSFIFSDPAVLNTLEGEFRYLAYCYVMPVVQ
jgi:hypothetical protein